MKAMSLTFVMPVALQYTTRALGSESCSFLTIAATFVLLLLSPPSLSSERFFALWHSSKMMQPSKSLPPHQLMI
jgi:hypothetical protein